MGVCSVNAKFYSMVLIPPTPPPPTAESSPGVPNELELIPCGVDVIGKLFFGGNVKLRELFDGVCPILVCVVKAVD